MIVMFKQRIMVRHIFLFIFLPFLMYKTLSSISGLSEQVCWEWGCQPQCAFLPPEMLYLSPYVLLKPPSSMWNCLCPVSNSKPPVCPFQPTLCPRPHAGRTKNNLDNKDVS